MKKIYEFYFNGRFYRSTDKMILGFFASLFAISAEIRVAGLSSEDIELERA